MLETVGNFIEAFDRALQHGAFLSVVLGLIVALGGTQWIKHLPWTSSNKWVIRLTALPLGAVTTFVAWPIAGFSGVRFAISVAVGCAAPATYQVAMHFVRKWWPDVAERAAAPQEPPP